MGQYGVIGGFIYLFHQLSVVKANPSRDVLYYGLVGFFSVVEQ